MKKMHIFPYFDLAQGDPGVVTCMDNRPHGLQTGQSIVFREVNGMEQLNGAVQHVSGILDYLFQYLIFHSPPVCEAKYDICMMIYL